MKKVINFIKELRKKPYGKAVIFFSVYFLLFLGLAIFSRVSPNNSRNTNIRIYNAVTNEEIAKYDLDEDFSIETAVEFGRLYRRNGEWKVEAMGLGGRDGLQGLVNKYA